MVTTTGIIIRTETAADLPAVRQVEERRASCETMFGFTKYLKNFDLARPLEALLAHDLV